MALVVRAADQAAEGLAEFQSYHHVSVGVAAEGFLPGALEDGRLAHGTRSSTMRRSESPGTSTPSRTASVPSRQASRLGAEHVDERAGIHRVGVLGVQRQPRLGHRPHQPPVHGEPRDGREQAKAPPPAARNNSR
jgi:hypothetical protein